MPAQTQTKAKKQKAQPKTKATKTRKPKQAANSAAVGGRAKITTEDAKAIMARLQSGKTTLADERERYGVQSNAPIRRAILIELDGSMAKYLTLIGRGAKN